MARIEGCCLCGGVRYSADAEPVFVEVCHGTDCQKFSGSVFATLVGALAVALKLTGTMKTFTRLVDSGTVPSPDPASSAKWMRDPVWR
jgi:hypothetical protein